MKTNVKTFKNLAAFVCCAVFMCSVTSCTKEDNPVPTIGSAAVTLNTQSLYEEIGFYNDAVSNLASGYFYLESTLLVYDEAGLLVGKYIENSNDFQPVSFKVSNLPNGCYTIMADSKTIHTGSWLTRRISPLYKSTVLTNTPIGRSQSE